MNKEIIKNFPLPKPPSQYAYENIPSEVELNATLIGDLFLYHDGEHVAYVGKIGLTGHYVPPRGWEEDGDPDCPELTCALQEELAKQIASDDPNGMYGWKVWEWSDYPTTFLRWAFSERPDAWRDALQEVAEAVHLEAKCPMMSWEEASEYADIMLAMDEGRADRFFVGRQDSYEEWQADCEAKGLTGWPREDIG